MPDAEDLWQATHGAQTQAAGLAVSSTEDNPDDAAEALRLGQATGTPPAVVHADLDGFKAQYKNQLTGDIVRNNPQIATYVRSHPLAASVSNDDYGNLDAFSQTAGRFAGFWKTLKAGYKGFVETAGQPSPDLALLPSSARVVALGMQGIAGVVGGAVYGVAEDYRQATGHEAPFDPADVTQALMDPGLQASLGPLGEAIGLPFEFARHNNRLLKAVTDPKLPEAVAAARPWVENGQEPPTGVHPIFDDLKIAKNEEGLKALDDAVSAAQSSATRERAPEMFQQFAAQHFGDARIGIAGDRVAELYGDKVPEAGDNLLGWVPDIAAQVEAARATGADIHVPIADWVTKVDPDLAKELHDDIRIYPGGITKREAEIPTEPTAPIDAPLAQARAAFGLEPLFSVGDRKLTLKPIDSLKAEWMKKFGGGFHDFDLQDESGRSVGTLNLSEQKGGKELYVEMVNGINGYDARSFGPTLMRSLLRQIKEKFPNAEVLTGHRVSGARGAAGTYDLPSAMPKIRLDNPEGWDFVEPMKELLSPYEYYNIGGGWQASVKPRELYTAHEAELVDAVNAEVQRIAPKKLEAVGAVDDIRNQQKPYHPRGMFIPSKGQNPVIIYKLLDNRQTMLNTGRHEAIHHLRQMGFFTPEEWSTLESASKAEGWIDRYGINSRYPGASSELKLEESIAEAFQDWAKNKDLMSLVRDKVLGESPASKVFRKIKELLDRIKARFAAILGHEPTWDELFEHAFSGEIGSREGTTPILKGQYIEPQLSADEGDMIKANASGLDLQSFRRLQRLIEDRHKADIEAATRRAQIEQTRRQSKEWKENRAELRKEVESNIRLRPDVAADLFLGSGELYGQKIASRYRIATDSLTPEQQASLPKSYYAKNGIPADDVAKLFGYQSGDGMVEKLAAYQLGKGDLSGQEFLKKVVDQETDRQMEARYGFLEKNIAEDVRDQVTSETEINRLAEEMHAVGMQVGATPIDAVAAKAWVKDRVGGLAMADVDSSKFLDMVGRHGRDAERSLIAGKPNEAFQSLQKKYLTSLFAREARGVEKEQASFDKVAKRFAKREVTGVDPSYTNFIHQILMQVGKPVRRSVQDLEESIRASGYAGLEEFVAEKEAGLRELPMAPFLYDQNFRKTADTLTVDEFRAVHDSIKALVHNGRDELKIERAGEAADLEETKEQMIGQLTDFAVQHYDTKGRRWLGPIPPRAAKVIRTYVAQHIQIETLFNRFDHFDPKGTWNQYVMRDLIAGANQESAWEKEFASQLLAADDGVDMRKSVENPIFRDPHGGGLMDFNRGNLRTVLLNAGNKSNLAKLAGGYGLKPEQVMAWLGKYATKEDWDWAQKVGDIFKDIKARSDTMYRSLTGGVAPESIEINPIATAHGTYDGWYYPIIFHPEFEGKSKKLMGGDALEQDNYVRATTPAGYTKGRTGYQAPLALDIDSLPGRMRSMLHDVAMRPAVLNASKIMYDKEIRDAIAAHYGVEYRDLLVPYLRDVANSSNYMSKPQKDFARWSEFFRQNMVSTLVGLNPGTVLKHGPTALVQSMQEVGPVNFLNAVKGLYSINEATGESNWQFAMNASQELQRRHRNYIETLSGASQELLPQNKFDSLRDTVLKYSSMPVAISDLVSAVPTWIARYQRSMEENGGIHGDAVYDADRAVRRAHGSTAITNRPAIMRDASPWITSVYSFFNHIMNRQAELVWKTGDAIGLAKDGQKAAAMAKVPEIAAGLFAYVLAPALIEELVTPLATNDRESWAKKAAKGIAFTLGASWVGVRDVASAVLNGRDPTVGLYSTAAQTITNLARDFGKNRPLSREHVGRMLQDASALFGTATGLMPLQVGRSARFVHDAATGVQHPRGPWSWLVGLRYGTLDKHSKTLDEWLHGRK